MRNNSSFLTSKAHAAGGPVYALRQLPTCPSSRLVARQPSLPIDTPGYIGSQKDYFM